MTGTLESTLDEKKQNEASGRGNRVSAEPFDVSVSRVTAATCTSERGENEPPEGFDGTNHGRPMGRERRPRGLLPLFWSKVDKNGPVPSHRPDLGPCWIWTGSRTKDGYGLWRGTKTAKQKLTHRVAWELIKGPIPAGILICHHCDNPPCCNPDHEFLGTNAQNAADCAAKGRTKEQRGSKHAITHLTEADVAEMRDAYWVRGEKLKSICERKGIRKSTGSYILNGRTWTHVPMPANATAKEAG